MILFPVAGWKTSTARRARPWNMSSTKTRFRSTSGSDAAAPRGTRTRACAIGMPVRTTATAASRVGTTTRIMCWAIQKRGTRPWNCATTRGRSCAPATRQLLQSSRLLRGPRQLLQSSRRHPSRRPRPRRRRHRSRSRGRPSCRRRSRRTCPRRSRRRCRRCSRRRTRRRCPRRCQRARRRPIRQAYRR